MIKEYEYIYATEAFSCESVVQNLRLTQDKGIKFVGLCPQLGDFIAFVAQYLRPWELAFIAVMVAPSDMQVLTCLPQHAPPQEKGINYSVGIHKLMAQSICDDQGEIFVWANKEPFIITHLS
ncbi:MAG: hypothetical protein EZS28_014446 [Streblomastix strix]|uniref:Uncharacterized protein n=1 Tax=Streblomastix strix TaxID=222440 RepID=A0A5J4W6D7_9EUKA|nr:MAG: hypothetical protein EZS28_014446 [Streblomastix strix]